ncbi:MAG TPA: ABC transporter permease [Bryobacteraceae bacterium]|nr:ABC transporter permease [Bryobacteraceae bacterium]
MRLSTLVTDIRKDVVYAVRALLKSPGFALVGIFSLGMGIGVPTVVFSEVNAIIFRDMPGAIDAGRLALVEAPVSYPYFERYREQGDMFAGAAAFQQSVPFSVALEGAKDAKKERIFGHIVSPEYFPVLGTVAARGRLFSPEIDKPGSPAEVVVSDRFWRNRLKADPNAVGRTIRINGRTATIVGIGPPDFLGVMPFLTADLFVPATAPPALAPELSDDVLHRRDRRVFRVVLRLKPGVTLQSAESALDSLTHHLDQETLDPDRDRKGRRVHLFPGGSVFPLPREAMPILYGFYGTLLGLILTIACMNLTNMMLARAASRRREVAIRLAVGASRFRLVRQLLTESVLLATCGGIAGLLLTLWLSHAAASLRLPVDIPYQIDISPDWRVLFFTLAVSVITGLLFGLAPALETVKTNLVTSLKEGGVVELRGYRRFGLRNLLMVWQVAASLMVLMISGFIILGIQKTSAVSKGVDVQHLYVFSMDPVRDGYSSEQASSLFEKLGERLGGVSAVRNVALADRVPFAPGQSILDFKVNALSGDDSSPQQMLERISTQAVGAGYFTALGVAVRSGREFTEQDERDSSTNRAVLRAILNEPAVRALFGHVSPLGQRISGADQSYEVVGVVPELRGGFSMNGESPVIYIPIARGAFAHPPVGGITVLIRALAGPDAVDGVRREIAAIDPNLSVFGMQPLQRQLDQMDAYLRVGASLYASLGLFGLVLSSIGLAGVTAYSVARRRKEIGIRVALGARADQVLRLVLREGGALILVGTVIGFAGAFAISRALSSLTAALGTVFASGTGDPTLLVGAPLLLSAVALLSCYVPARKSTQIDPLAALRQE